MITEIAILNVKTGMENDFEKDFIIASQYISSIKGYIKHSLKKCIEIENQYLLIVEWNNIESHTIGFRKSEVYLKWKDLLHHYYKPFPTVEHYKEIELKKN